MNRILIFLFTIFVTWLFLNPINIDGQTFWMDHNGLININDSLVNYFFAWKNSLLGSVNFTSFSSISNYFIHYLGFSLFGLNSGYFFVYFVIISLTYFFGYKITDLYIKEQKYSLFIAALYVFNLPLLRYFYGQGTTTFLLGGLGLIMTIFFVLKDKKVTNINLILIFFSSLLVTHPFMFFFYYFILISLFYAYHKKVKKIIWLSFGLFFLHFFWIFQFIIGKTINYSDNFQETYSDSLVNVFSINSQLFKSGFFLSKNFDFIEKFFVFFPIIIYLSIFLLWIMFIKNTLSQKQSKKSIVFLLIIIFLLLFSIGPREPLGFFYSYMQEKFSFFSVFRTYSNVLLFCSIIWITYIIKYSNKQLDYKILRGISIAIIFCFGINTLFSSETRSTHIPKDYFIVKKIIDQDTYTNTILLPCSTYDYYKWDNENQDKYFLDAFFKESGLLFYRPTLIDNKVINGIFTDICNYRFNFNRLSNYNVNYIIVRKDLIYPEKKFFKPYDSSFLKSGLDLIYSSENLELYKTRNNKNNSSIIYQSPIKYSYVGSSSFENEITLKTNYNPNWKVYIEKKPGILSMPLGELSHKKSNIFGNSWNISKQEIISHVNTHYSKELKKEGYPKTLADGGIDYKYYTLNPDGSIDTELTIYFKPQFYFYLGLIISGTTFLLLILWLIIDSIYSHKRRKDA